MTRALGLLLVATLGFAGCGDLSEDAPAVSDSGMEREIKGFTLTETQNGLLRWSLRAETAWRIPAQPEINLDDVRLDFHAENGDIRSWLTARRGVVQEDRETFTARNDVLVISLEGDTLRTDELTYDKATDRISGPGWVRIAKPDRVLTGEGYEAKPDLSDYTVRENVRVRLIDREGVLRDAP